MTPSKRCAFLTMENPEGFFAYDHLAHEPLASLGWRVDDIPWQSTDVHWDDFDLVVIRSPWDYQKTPARFLRLLEQIERSQARLENPLSIVRWNMVKTYLKDLEGRGVQIVPTLWLSGLDGDGLADIHERLHARHIVIKPVIGANADDTFRLTLDTPADILQEAVQLFHSRELLAQPFIEGVTSVGEYSLMYFGGEYSHCVLKTPTPGDFRVQEEHGGQIRTVTPDHDLLLAGQAAIDAIESTPLYARVDLVRLPSGQPALMELELIEPSLYFPYHPESPGRFARAVDRLFAT